MKIDVTPYEIIHAYDIIDRNVREQDLWLSGQDWETAVKGWKDGGPGYTLLIDEKVVGCGGVVLTQWQCGEAWTLFSTLFFKHYRTAYKAIKKNLENIIEDENLRRVQSLIHPEHEEAKRFIIHLGFQCEGLLRKYGPNGEDLFMYSRVMEVE